MMQASRADSATIGVPGNKWEQGKKGETGKQGEKGKKGEKEKKGALPPSPATVCFSTVAIQPTILVLVPGRML